MSNATAPLDREAKPIRCQHAPLTDVKGPLQKSISDMLTWTESRVSARAAREQARTLANGLNATEPTFAGHLREYAGALEGAV